MDMQEDATSSTSGSLPKVEETDAVVARLRAENAQLRAELARARGDGAGLGVDGTATGDRSWQEAMRLGIGYADERSSTSAASAGRLLAQGFITEPQERNAVAVLRDVQRLDPGNARADELLVQAAARLAEVAQEAFAAGLPESARHYLDLALTVTPDQAEWRSLRESWQ